MRMHVDPPLPPLRVREHIDKAGATKFQVQRKWRYCGWETVVEFSCLEKAKDYARRQGRIHSINPGGE